VVINTVLDEVNSWALDDCPGQDEYLYMRDIPIVMKDVQSYTAFDDLVLRQAVLSWSIANTYTFAYNVETLEAVQAAIREADHVLFNFGMNVGKDMEMIKVEKIDGLKRQVTKKVLVEARKVPKEDVN
jgi:hypothetical protein